MNDFYKGRTLLIRTAIFVSALSLATPAVAATNGATTSLAHFALFTLGVTGLMIGHFGTRRQPPGK